MKDVWYDLWSSIVCILGAGLIVVGVSVLLFPNNSTQPEDSTFVSNHTITIETISVVPGSDVWWYGTGGMLDYVWWKESRYGTDPKCRKIGPAGEEGEYQITPIWKKDYKRLFGVDIDPYNNAECRVAIRKWLEHYCDSEMITNDDGDGLYRIYNRGPQGARQ